MRHRSLPVIRRVALLAALGVFPALPASAAAPVKILGLPDMGCKAWADTRFEPERREPYLQWVRGFLSGHNYANPAAQVAEVSAGTVAVFVDRYCAEHAAATVAEAAMRMSDRYSGRNAPVGR
jgi:hypothetical protein